MKTRLLRTQLLASTVLITGFLALFPTGSASAQTSQPQAVAGADSTAPTEEIVVTGSRIRQPNLTSTSPLTIVGSDEIKLQGTTNVETLLNNLPQGYLSQSSQVSNGATGTAQISLRNLGPQRTLVLVDGRRLMPGDPGYNNNPPTPDLNNIPAALVDRVDIITGGASAVYGSDAVAGVVNFVLKKNFVGVQIDAQTSFANHQQGNAVQQQLKAFGIPVPSDVGADGWVNDVSVILGTDTASGSGNITAYATYRDTTPVLQSTRDYSACGISVAQSVSNGPFDHYICQGSSNSAYGRFIGSQPVPLSDNPDGSRTFVPYTGALAFNFAPVNYIQRADERYTAGFFAHQKVSDHAQVYADFMMADDQSFGQIAPSGLFQGTGAGGGPTFAINCDNPLLGPSQAAALCGAAAGTSANTNQIIGYRFASFPRRDELRHFDYKIDLGIKGDLGPDWSYDAYIQYGTAKFSERFDNDISISRVQNALQVVNVNGVPTCKSKISGTDAGCVPLDIFVALGKGFTPAALAYVSVPGVEQGATVEQVANISVTGDLGRAGVKSPWAHDGVGVAFGSEYRREQLYLNADEEYLTGDLAGQGGPKRNVSGSFDLYELFGEVRVPLAQNQPFVRDLSLGIGYRFSDYSSAGVTNTYKFEGNYSPLPDVRFRLGYNRAVRAPNIQELYTPAVVANVGAQDPCANDPGTAPSASATACANTGVTAAEYGHIPTCPSSQCSQLTGGNAALKPESSDTYTAGVIFTPTFIKGFSATIDYYDIRVDNLIGSVPISTTLSQCLAGVQSFCGAIHRDPASGILFGQTGYVNTVDVNTGYLQTRGIDVNVNYRLPLAVVGLHDSGTVTFSLLGTYTDSFVAEPVAGLGSYDCAGKFGTTCLFPQPKWRHEARATWATPWNLNLSVNWRYLSGSKLDINDSNPLLNGGVVDTADARIPSYSYFDLAASWRVGSRYTLRAGVNNVFDKDPPIVDFNRFGVSTGPFGNANTYPTVYDTLGRVVFVGITADF